MSFTLDPGSQDDVEADFTGSGLAAGSSTYFSLEGALTAAVVTARKGGLNSRYVALGDSVPYGHGLANPYPSPQIGLPAADLQQGPSNQAYPALVATALHLTMSIRSTNCTLAGDDLAISGASAASADAGAGNDQCTVWSDSESVQRDELPAAQLSQNPATLVTIQAGADDIDFGDCMAWELTKFAAFHAQGTRCVKHGSVTPALAAELANLHDALVNEIEQSASHAKHIAVLDYYQVIPRPADFKKASIFPGGQIDPVCWGLSHNLKGAHNDAVIVQSALNTAIVSAVSDAITAGVSNVQLIDISNLEASHEICTGNPALFSGEPLPKSQFHHDLGVLVECHVPVFKPKSCRTAEPKAEEDLKGHSWRAAHPNSFGQQDIARAIESQLNNL
jgi:lysophospholipase L1-like esterase